MSPGVRGHHLVRTPALAPLALVLAACSGSGDRAIAASPMRVAALSITAPATSIPAGGTVQLTATPRDTLQNPLAGRRVDWTSDDTTVATVSPTGLVTGVSAGTVIVAAADGGRREPVAITVASAGAAVPVRPGEDLQAKVDSHPAGTTFLVAAGVHRRQSVVPKDGMSFIGEPGARLDGEGVTRYAFNGNAPPHPRNVTIRGLVIERYAPPVQYGAIRADVAMGGWVVEECEIRYNATGGIRLGPRAKVRRNHVHHNGQIGILGGGDDVLIEGNEIAYNNPQASYDMYWEAGGTKFARTRDLVVRGNFVHHNHGPGLWTDIDNIRTLYEHNRVEDNAEAGIFHEISYAAVIRHNATRRNGTHAVPEDWVTGAGILVSVSRDVEVYGNIVEDNRNGITAIQRDRGEGEYGPYVLENLDVHDNTVTMRTGVTGIATGGLGRLVDRATYTSRGNRFRANSYRLGPNGPYFQWRGARRTEREWRAYGQDTAGKFSR